MDMGVQRGDAEDWFYGPGMILGSNEITPLSMATAMATLAAEGNSCSPSPSRASRTMTAPSSLRKTPSCKRVIEPELARETTAVLQYVMTPGSTGENAILYGRQAAGKTGTSNDDADAWFVGYTPQLSAAIWSGHLEGNTPMLGSVINGRYYWEVYGSLFPALTFSGYMNQALADQPVAYFNAPDRNVITNPNPPRATTRPKNSTTTHGNPQITSRIMPRARIPIPTAEAIQQAIMADRVTLTTLEITTQQEETGLTTESHEQDTHATKDYGRKPHLRRWCRPLGVG